MTTIAVKVAAIFEDKYFSAVLAHIKIEQVKAATKSEVDPTSARNGNSKTGLLNDG